MFYRTKGDRTGIKEIANGICDENILKLVVVMIAIELYAFQMGEFSGM